MGTSGMEWVFGGIGWALVAAGVVVCAWGIWWDRARGRRRCGKCWYDMGAVAGLKCPECGREVKGERGLLRTRRRWRWAAFAVVLVAAGWCVMNVPDARRRSAWALVPRPALGLLMPLLKAPPVLQGGAPPVDHLAAEIGHRYLKDAWTLRRLWPGERLALRAGASMALGGGGAERFAAKMLVLAEPGTPGPDGRATNAAVVMARMGLEYARCATYWDEGLVKGTIGGRDEKPFVTMFERGGRFRFEFRSMHPFQVKFTTHYVVWGPIAAPKSWWTIGGQVQEFNDIGMALAGPTGVSGGAAIRAPSMLLAGRNLWTGIATLEGITGVEVFDGRPCYVIRGRDFLDFPVDWWIDCEQFMLRKVHDHWEYPSVTVYRPRLGAAVSDADFVFDPAKGEETPLGDGERVSNELRELAGDPREGAVPVPEEKKMKLPGMPGR